MKLYSLVALCIVGLTSVTEGYNIYKATTVNCRSSPSTSGKIVRTYTAKDNISLSCQTSGTNVNGNTLWDKTTAGCYISDYYLKTGSNGYVASKCSSGGGSTGGGGGSTNKVPGPIKDDYPYPGQCDGIDPWHYFKCQCTSFVAWRINSRLGVKFNNYYKGPNWGDAKTWSAAARKTGVPINNKPVAGCVAQTTVGTYGHVAWVAKVSGSQVTIEEYNHGGTRKYNTRTVPASSFNYIHIKV